MIDNGILCIRENGFDNQITLIRGQMEEVHLPVEKVQCMLYIMHRNSLYVAKVSV